MVCPATRKPSTLASRLKSHIILSHRHIPYVGSMYVCVFGLRSTESANTTLTPTVSLECNIDQSSCYYSDRAANSNTLTMSGTRKCPRTEIVGKDHLLRKQKHAMSIQLPELCENQIIFEGTEIQIVLKDCLFP